MNFINILKKFVIVYILVWLLLFVFNSESVNAQEFNATLMPPKVYMNLDKGKSYDQKFEIRNDSEGKVTFYIEKSDLYAENETGTPVFIDRADGDSFSLSKWMTFDKNTITLSKGEVGAVNVKINVPENAEPGGHYGAIWFSTVPAEQSAGSNVAIGTNFIGQLIVNVNGEVYRDVVIEDFRPEKTIYTSLPIKFKLKIVNNGNTHFEPVGRLKITNRITKKEYNIQLNQKNQVVLPKLTREYEEIWREDEEDNDVIPKIGLYDVEYRLAGDLPFVTNNNVKRSVWVLPPKIVIGFIAIIITLVLVFKLYGSMAVKRANKKK